MNNPNPFMPSGSILEQRNKARARLRVSVFCSLSVSVVALLTPLLIQGCRKPTETETTTLDSTNLPMGGLDVTNIVVTDTNPGPVVVASNPPPVPLPLPPVTEDYIVATGDTFSKIATNHHVSVRALREANPTVNERRLKVGQKIVIPPATTPTTPTAVTTTTATTTTPASEDYTVKSGDTLTKIAADHHVSVKDLKALNNLTTDKIKVGQKLKIPPTAPAPTL